MASLKDIISWFKEGLYPTEGQFQETWKSFWHKSEKIPQTQVFGLENALNNVSIGMIYKPPVKNVSDLATTYPNAKPGWSVKVESNGYIYQYDGTQWNDTGLTAFPGNVATKEDLEASNLIDWILSESYSINNTLTYDYDGNVKSPINVTYPDDSTGVITFTRDSEGLISKLEATKGSKKLTVTLTRNIEGQVLTKKINYA